MKTKHAQAHMKTAYNYASLSYATRRKVGCVIIKDNSIISIGWNGMAPGEDNNCEDENGKTKPGCIHAEDNALRKLTRSHESAVGSTVFVTLVPCELCAPRLVEAKVSKVYYCEYKPKHQVGIDFLLRHGVEVEQLVLQEE